MITIFTGFRYLEYDLATSHGGPQTEELISSATESLISRSTPDFLNSKLDMASNITPQYQDNSSGKNVVSMGGPNTTIQSNREYLIETCTRRQRKLRETQLESISKSKQLKKVINGVTGTLGSVGGGTSVALRAFPGVVLGAGIITIAVTLGGVLVTVLYEQDPDLINEKDKQIKNIDSSIAKFSENCVENSFESFLTDCERLRGELRAHCIE